MRTLSLLLAFAAAPLAAQPLLTLAPPDSLGGGRFGDAVAGVPDTDADGVDDILVGASVSDVDGIDQAGRAFLLSGASGNILLALTSPTPENFGRFGGEVAAAGDVDGDGRGDLLVGAAGESDEPSLSFSAGRAYVFSGATGALLRTLASPNPEAFGSFGISISEVPDTDGDDMADHLVGATGETVGGAFFAGRAYLFSGTTGALLLTLTSPNAESTGRFGGAVAGVSDANGDGRGDLLVGAPGETIADDADAGRAYLFSGTTGALLGTFTSPDPGDFDAFGRAVAGVPDADGDGRGDLLVGAPGENAGFTLNGGQAYLFSGATGLLLHRLVSPNADPFGDFGRAVTGISGDGRGNLLVGAPNENGGGLSSVGRAYVFSGATGDLLDTIESPDPEEWGSLGTSVAGAGDLDGDGAADLLVGAPREDGGTLLADGRAYAFAGPAPSAPGFDLTASATTPLAVAPGGSVSFTYAVTNNTAAAATGDVFYTAARSGSTVAQGNVTSGTLPAGQTASGSYTQAVPASAPAGDYAYCLRVGNFPGTSLDAACFTLTVTAVTAARAAAARAWSVMGPTPWASTSAASADAAVGLVPGAMAVYPNPARGATTVAFALPETGLARVAVYDVLGREVAVLGEGAFDAGRHEAGLDAAGLPAGAYLVRVEVVDPVSGTGGRTITHRLTLLR